MTFVIMILSARLDAAKKKHAQYHKLADSNALQIQNADQNTKMIKKDAALKHSVREKKLVLIVWKQSVTIVIRIMNADPAIATQIIINAKKKVINNNKNIFTNRLQIIAWYFYLDSLLSFFFFYTSVY